MAGVSALEMGVDEGDAERTAPEVDEADLKSLSACGLVLNKDECTVSDGVKTYSLTKVELRVLEMFMEQPRRVFTSEQIYERGWGDANVVDDNTIRVTISHLREKIGNAKITNIRGLGYRFEDGVHDEKEGGRI